MGGIFQKLYRGPFTTALLLLLTFLFLFRFVFDLWLGGGEILSHFVGLTHIDIREGGEVWRFFTFFWFHRSLLLFLVNGILLWLFVPHLVGKWGIWKFGLFFLVCGSFGGVSAFLFSTPDERGLIGVTAAVVGVCLAQYREFPNRRVVGQIPVRVGIWMCMALPVVLHYFVDHGGDPNAGVSQAGGLLSAWLFLALEPWMRRLISKYNQHRRRREQEKQKEIQARVERLLEKIQEEGVQALTADERAFLKRASDTFREEMD